MKTPQTASLIIYWMKTCPPKTFLKQCGTPCTSSRSHKFCLLQSLYFWNTRTMQRLPEQFGNGYLFSSWHIRWYHFQSTRGEYYWPTHKKYVLPIFAHKFVLLSKRSRNSCRHSSAVMSQIAARIHQVHTLFCQEQVERSCSIQKSGTITHQGTVGQTYGSLLANSCLLASMHSLWVKITLMPFLEDEARNSYLKIIRQFPSFW